MSTNMAQKKFFILASIFLLVLSLSLIATGDTLVVSKNGGWFDSIQNAINEAEPGDTVKVKKGTYKENLAVDKDLTIKGKDTEEVKIEGVEKGQPVLVAGPSRIDLTMVNVTLQGAEGKECKDYQKGICPDGLVARGESAVTLKSSAFQQNKDAGISLLDSARATIQNSKIAGNDYGIQLYSSTQVTIEKSEVTNNAGGIWLRDFTQSTITNNKLSSNGSGIVIHNSAQATIKHNVLRGNDTGITNYSNGTVEFQDNEIGNNLVNFVGNIDGKLRDRLREPTAHKIVMPDGDYPSFQHAIDALQPGGTIVLEGKLEGGVVIDKELTIKAGVKDAQVFLPEKANAPVLSVIKGGDLRLEGLKVKNPGNTWDSYGIVLGGNSKMQLENSTVRGSVESVKLTNSAQATITKSRLIGGFLGSLSLQNSAEATIKNSKLISEFIGIGLMDSAQATVINSKISGNEISGVYLAKMTQATLSNNKITRSKRAGVELVDLARANISNNEITENGAGILLHGSAQALVGYNTIRKNKTGIKTSQGFGGILEGSDNQVAENDMNFQGVPETVQKELTKS